MKCDNCGKEIGNGVYFVPGIKYSCCSLTCISKMTVRASITTVEEREKYLNNI